MTGILIVLVFFAIWFSTSYRVFKGTFSRSRRKLPDLIEIEKEHGSWFSDYKNEIITGINWFRTTPREHWETRSHDRKTLGAYFYPRENARGAVLLFHGYMSTCENDFCGAAKWYYDNGFSVLGVCQRAHDISEGKYITLGARERKDVHAWVNEATRRLGTDTPLILSGVSMGATAVLCASEAGFGENVRLLVADCGFESPKRTLTEQLARRGGIGAKGLLFTASIFARVTAKYSLTECSTVRAMETNTLPVFFVHGTGDVVVPHQNSVDAAAACKAPHVLKLIEGAHHTAAFIVGGEELHRELLEFIDKYI